MYGVPKHNNIKNVFVIFWMGSKYFYNMEYLTMLLLFQWIYLIDNICIGSTQKVTKKVGLIKLGFNFEELLALDRELEEDKLGWFEEER